jgi:glyoxylase-like metal-dependent hydrolase (beta-lactamase superfamily II)
VIKLATGLLQLRLRNLLLANVFFIEDDGQLVLVDAGMRGDAGAILRAAGRLGWPGRSLREIVITHGDIDHLGAAGQLAETTGAAVIAHRAELPLIAARGYRPLASHSRIARLARPLSHPMMRAMCSRVPIHVARVVEDGDELAGGFRVVHTPGHTPGHIALYHPLKRALLAGDALSNLVGVHGPTGLFTPDMPLARASMRRLAELDVEVAGFGHGPPLQHDAGAQIRKYLDSLA